MIKPASPSAFDAFYDNPSPARAVALAIADHKALSKSPIWEYVGELQKAQDCVDAYPRLLAERAQLVAALRDARNALRYYGATDDRAWVNADALLRDLGEE